MTYHDQFEQAVENYTMLAALKHRRLHDGRISDGRAEGLLAMIKAWQESTRARLDISGLTFAA